MTRSTIPDPLKVPAHEAGVVRVFEPDLDRADLERLKRAPANGAEDPLAALLGVDEVNREGVEIFPVADLAGLGLAGYLSEGGGIPEAALAPDAQRLSEIEGHVVLVYSRAFGGKATELHPDPRLTLVGAWAEPRDTAVPRPIESEAANPYTGTAHHPKRPAPPARGPRFGVATIAAVIGAILVVILLMALPG